MTRALLSDVPPGGTPTITFPTGMSSIGLPLSMQLIGLYDEEFFQALGPLAAGETEAALTGLAASCGDILAAHFPPGEAVDPAKQRFHIV